MTTNFVIFLLVTLALAQSAPTENGKGTCQCGAFKDAKDAAGEPIVFRPTPLKVACTADGKEDCKKMCKALAEIAREKVPHAVCAKLDGIIDSMKPSAFYKACDAPEWTYADLTASDGFCCKRNSVVPCKLLKE